MKLTVVSIFVCVLVSAKVVTAVSNFELKQHLSIQTFYGRILKLFDDFKNGHVRLTLDGTDSIVPVPILNGEFNNQVCDNQLRWFQEKLIENDMRALYLFDSWGKIPPGIMFGNYYDLGSFDQCLETVLDTQIASIGEVKGQYCLSMLNLDDINSTSIAGRMAMAESYGPGQTLGIGICAPASCSPLRVKLFFEELISQVNLTSSTYEPATYCYTNDAIQLDGRDISAITILAVVLLLMILSTFYDVYMKQRNSAPVPVLLAFSVYSNGKRLFSLNKSKSADVINCLDGIRAISITWIIYMHAYSVHYLGIVANTSKMAQWGKNGYSLLVLSGGVAVDSFFLLSGFLVAWSALKKLDKRSLNIPMMYLHRYLRLTPSLAVLILLGVSLMRYVGEGPFNNAGYSIMFSTCTTYWWSALLYVQNYVNPNAMCVSHSWYLMVDMQLYIISPLVLFPLWKWGKKFIGVILVIAISSAIWSIMLFYNNEMTLSMLDGGSVMSGPFSSIIYYATHIRCGAWLTGVVWGYILHIYKHKTLNLSRLWISLGWIVALGTIFAIIFGQYDIQNPETEENHLESAFYQSLSRLTWCIALGWIIFACVKGYGGFVNSMLSHPLWQPISRMSYSLYLLHLIIQSVLSRSIKTQRLWSDWRIAHSFWGDFGFSLTVSVIWVLAFESPIPIIEAFLFHSKKVEVSPKENGNDQPNSPKTDAQENV